MNELQYLVPMILFCQKHKQVLLLKEISVEKHIRSCGQSKKKTTK